MCTGRTHARICLSTAELLDAIRVRITLAEEKGHIRRWWDDEQLTTAELIDRVVRTYHAHMERGRKSRTGKGRRRNAVSCGGALTPPSEEELLHGQYALAELKEGGSQI